MDNVTHSLIGLAAGEAWAVTRKKERAPLWIASLLANNFPDIDVPIGSWLTQDGLSRLLFHRGHTHTLAFIPVQGLVLFFLLWLLYRKKPHFSARDTLGVVLLGLGLHIFADSWNSYGVHPFWPFDNRWYYGDFVFILEPWIWVILLPPLFFATNSKIFRVLFSIFGGGIMIAAWTNEMVPLLVAGMLSIFLVGFTLLQRWIPSPGRRVASAVIAMAIFLGSFALISNGIAREYGSASGEIALSPFPGNPFCWTAQRARFEGDEYVAEALRIAPWPKVFSVQQCPDFYRPVHGLLEHMTAEPSDAMEPVGRFRGKRSEFEAIARDCRGQNFLRFARIPFWKAEGEGFAVGDLRFARGGRRGFAQVNVPGACPDLPAPWIGRFHPDHH